MKQIRNKPIPYEINRERDPYGFVLFCQELLRERKEIKRMERYRIIKKVQA